LPQHDGDSVKFFYLAVGSSAFACNRRQSKNNKLESPNKPNVSGSGVGVAVRAN
jgi:hypothetical protein